MNAYYPTFKLTSLICGESFLIILGNTGDTEVVTPNFSIT